ncbi:MAG TPA: acetolactate synthase small subunit [Acidobacteriaceae bacterium]|nr:acetolactate synthase small subunit [Acidobacteriaceae bacterium]
MLHTFVALVEDKPGVLTRVASLFRRLNINITSLTVGNTENDGVSRMTIVAEAAEDRAHRMMASLYKLENVLEVDDVGRHSAVIRELALLKVECDAKNRADLFQLAEVFHARIVDLAPESLMMEITGSASKIEGLVQILVQAGYRILEMARTGRMAMRRGRHTSRVLAALNDTNSTGSPSSTPQKPANLMADQQQSGNWIAEQNQS